MKLYAVKWFPLAIFASLMCMPQILNYSVFSTTFIPIMFLIWLMAIVYCFDVKLPRCPTLLLLILLGGQLLLWATGQVHNVEFFLLGLVWVFVAFMLFSCMVYVTQYTQFYLYSFMGVAVLWSIVAAIVWFGFTDGKQLAIAGIALSHIAQPKPAGSFANGNVFGIMMVCAWLVSSKLWLTHDKFTGWFGFLSLFFLVWVFASMSRGAWLALLVVYVMIVIHLVTYDKWLKLLIFLLVSVAAWLLAAEMVSYVTVNEDLSRRAEEIVTMGARQVLYPAGFEVWRSHWLLGVGLGNFAAHFLTGQEAALSYLPAQLHGMGATSNAHNHFLHMLSSCGVIGLLVWVSIAVLLFKSIWKVCFLVEHPAWLPLSIALVLWIQGLFNISMVEAIPFFVFFMSLGLGFGILRGMNSPDGAIRLTKAPFFLMTTFLVLVLSFYSYTTVQAWETLEKAMFTTSAKDRGKYVAESFAQRNPSSYPYLAITVVSDSLISKKGDAEYWGNIRPVIQFALQLQESPELYQGLFYSEVINKNWDRACELGIFLKHQRWEKDRNVVAYDKACHSELVENFTIGW